MMTTAERVAKQKAERIAAGGKRMSVWVVAGSPGEMQVKEIERKALNEIDGKR